MLTTVSQLRREGNLPDSIKEEYLIPHLVKAEIEMKTILSPELYAKISSLNADDNDFITCSAAEANIALSYALPSLNIETQGSGIVRSKGWGESRSELLGEQEVEKLQFYYREVAMTLLKPVMLNSGQPDNKDEVCGANNKLSVI